MPRNIRIKDGSLTFDGTRATIKINEPGAPNLDGHDPEWLMTFWHMTYIGGWAPARFLFPDRPTGYVNATHALGNYASNKATAMGLRAKGDIGGALAYERICDAIYEQIPEYARW
jgi:hypothetical protein